jgi:hypothetical protein
MATLRLTRWTGSLAALGGGAWLALGAGSASPLDRDDAGVVLFALPVLFLLTGLVGLHARQAARAGWAAWTVGFAAANGLALVLAGQIGAPWGLPTRQVGTFGLQVFALAAFVLALGSLVYGVTALRGPHSFRVAAALLIAGSPAPLLAFDADRGPFAAALWLLFGAGWLALGVLLWRGSPAFAARPLRFRFCGCPAA